MDSQELDSLKKENQILNNIIKDQKEKHDL
jgi:hypothetical protein